MRLFIAINFDDTELDAFEAARERLRAQAGAANYSRRENLHLTLAFLGEQPPARMGEISGAMLKATKKVPGVDEAAGGARRRTEGERLQAGGPALHTASHAGARGPGRGGARACTARARPGAGARGEPYALGAQTGSFDLYSAALLRLCALTRRRRSCYDDWYGRRREHEGI